MPGNTPQRLSLKCAAQSKKWIQDSNNDSAVSSKLATALPSMEAWNRKKSLEISNQRGQQTLKIERYHRNNHGSLQPIEKHQNYLKSTVPQKPSTEERQSDDERITMKNTSVHRSLLSQEQRSLLVSPNGNDILSKDECKSQKKINKRRNNNTYINIFHLSGQEQFSDKKRQQLLPISSAAGSQRYMNDIAHMLNEDIVEYNGESNQQTSHFKDNKNLSKFTSQTEVHQKSIELSTEQSIVKETESQLTHRNALIKSRLSSKERRSRMKERADRFQRFEDEKELDFFSQKEILHAAERIIQDINQEEAEKRRQKLFSENLVERDEEELKIVKCNFIQKTPLVQLTDQINFETHVKERMTLLDNIENENYRLKYGLDEKATKEGVISKNQQVSVEGGGGIQVNEINIKVNIVQGNDNDNDPRAKLFERLSKQTTESQRIRDQARRFHRSQQASRSSSSKKESYLELNSNVLEESIKEITSYQKSLRESKKFDDDKRKISQFLSSIFLESDVKAKIELPIVLAAQTKPRFKKFQIIEMPLQKNG